MATAEVGTVDRLSFFRIWQTKHHWLVSYRFLQSETISPWTWWTWWAWWTWLSISDSSRKVSLFETLQPLSEHFFPMASNESFLVLQSPNFWRGPSRNPSNLKAFWSAVASFLFSLDCPLAQDSSHHRKYPKYTTWTRPWPSRVFLQCGIMTRKKCSELWTALQQGKTRRGNPSAQRNPSFGVATREFPFESNWSIWFKTWVVNYIGALY